MDSLFEKTKEERIILVPYLAGLRLNREKERNIWGVKAGFVPRNERRNK